MDCGPQWFTMACRGWVRSMIDRPVARGRRLRGKPLKIFYYIFLTINAITLAVLFFFFMWGLSDGTVSSFNILLWLAMLGIPSATLLGGWVQWGKGNHAFAMILLLLPSFPALLFA